GADSFCDDPSRLWRTNRPPGPQPASAERGAPLPYRSHREGNMLPRHPVHVHGRRRTRCWRCGGGCGGGAGGAPRARAALSWLAAHRSAGGGFVATQARDVPWSQATRSYHTVSTPRRSPQKLLSVQVAVHTDGPFDCDTNNTACFCAAVIEVCVMWSGKFPEMALLEVSLPVATG
ncbi:unnamed protein product, partial [Arctia plantaginis]